MSHLERLGGDDLFVPRRGHHHALADGENRGKALLHHAEGEHGGKLSGTLYARVAKPVLASKKASGLFLLVTVVLSWLARAALHQAWMVKLLPFDNKSELAVVIDLARGRLGRGDRCGGAAGGRGRTRPGRGDHGAKPMPAPAAPFNFNGLVRHYLRSQSHLGDVAINLDRQGRARPPEP
ncbi:MAG: hypothetical protein R3D78_03045 [Paracoccaceae bacterium]